jgi:SAM-dependent methyltransferase
VAFTGATCPQCAKTYAIEDGVICTDRQDVFMGEFDARHMREFVALARANGWRPTVEEHMARRDPGAGTILLGRDRASFLELLRPQRNAAVLDLGAGMGAISLQLSRSFARVYAVDQTFERLAFLQVIAEQEHIEAIRPICHRDVLHLPFNSGTLDAAVMVGVFEYLPASYDDLTVYEVQRRALEEVNRVLAPEGVLFIATKNRFGWPYWGGATDNSGLRFVSLLPRWSANIASRIKLRRPYRIVTDSYWRYRSMLMQSGFENPRFFWPKGGYQLPESWVDMSDRRAVISAVAGYPGGLLKRMSLATLAATGATRFAVPHFGIVAKKSEPSTS